MTVDESSYARSAEFYDLVYAHKPYAQEAEAVHRAIQAHLRSGGDALLHVGCGTGGHLEHLGRHYRCEGLDLDEGLLAIARERHPGARFHRGDMADFDLGRRFDAIVSLFSAIGYVRAPERLQRTIRAFARHLEPGGVAVVEPWFTPDVFQAGNVMLLTVDRPEVKLARMSNTDVRDGVSLVTFSYLIGRGPGVEHVEEVHELGLFTHEQTVDAFRAAGLEVVEHDPQGLTGRGLYVARRPAQGVHTAPSPEDPMSIGEQTAADPRYPVGRFRIETEIAPQRRREWIEQVAEAPARLRAAVQDLAEEQLDTPYREGGWTVRQLAHHVPDSHMNAYVRFKLGLTEDNPPIKTYEEARWAELEDTRATPVETSLALLELLHERWVALMRAMTDEQWARTVQHPEWGTIRLDSMLGLYAWHGRHHVAHVTALRERMGWQSR